jgi:hypothetical protein
MTPTVTKKTREMIRYALGQSLVQLASWQRERKILSVKFEEEMRDISILIRDVENWDTMD